ncbi:hypothetical protein Sjap_018751 [Stephania japonica]|uniref:Uncharacterized protein n=1 Tax=Stephania japonica TaxID=461633 RepID=A0AAP0I8H8_9MAGN
MVVGTPRFSPISLLQDLSHGSSVATPSTQKNKKREDEAETRGNVRIPDFVVP